MRVYKSTNVFDEALNRIRRLFDEFDEVFVSVSGGKDSTVIYELSKIVAREKGKLPLKVLFLDQEAEWQATIDMIKGIMYDPDVEPYWYQVPIKLFNATSQFQDWLHCWEEGADWMREKDPIAIHENPVETDRFVEFFQQRQAKYSEENGNIKACDITGMRAEESPNRFAGLTQTLKYKDITWGRKNKYSKNCFTFHPIYDWSYLDVWKAIHDNKWSYCKLYDYQYQYGLGIHEMRVSNLHHETAVQSLFVLQEVEPETYDKLTQRLHGIDTAGKLGKDDYYIDELPFMFKDWREYRDYLLENLIIDQDKRASFASQFNSNDKYLAYGVKPESMHKIQISSILANDFLGAKLKNAEVRWRYAKREWERNERRKLKSELRK